MAGGKVSPRQKMINLMYLVFIAMLAMNMDKEVLSAFGFMTEELTESNKSITTKNAAAYGGLTRKAKEQKEKYGPLKRKADKIKSLSMEFYSYLEELKLNMTANVEDKTAYSSMDKPDFLDEYFFKGDGLKPAGKEFVDRINTYRFQVLEALGVDESELADNISTRFNTEPIENKQGKTIGWIDYRFKGYPLVASLTSLTQLQANIKNTESDILTTLLRGQLQSEVLLTNYQGIVRLDKTAYFAGERVQGQVVLGRYDATLVPNQVVLNGNDVTNSVKDGQVMIDMPAGNVGDKTIKGTIFFTENGVKVPVNFESEYSVISQPDEAVISADKMNVVYRGLDNPISVSLPGVGDKDLNVSAPGLKKVAAGKYVLQPGKADAVTINVTGTLGGGKKVTSKKEFRVKDIPAAMGSVRGQFGIIKMPKSSLANAPIGAGLPDFEFDLQLSVSSFKVNVPGQLTVINNGSQFNAQAKKALEKARRGDVITIFDIEASIIGNSSYKLKQVLPVSIDITN